MALPSRPPIRPWSVAMLNANGVPTIDRTRIGATPVVRKALLAGEIDLYVEYTGNAGFFFNDVSNAAWKDLAKGYELGARLDYDTNHIVWLTPAHGRLRAPGLSHRTD